MSGSCVSTVPMEKTIENEIEWANNCILDLKSDHLESKFITADPDSSVYRAATELYTNKVTITDSQKQIYTRHLGDWVVGFVALRPSQQLWSLRDSQFT